MRKQTNTLSPSLKGFQSPKFSDSDFRKVRGLGLGRPKSSAKIHLEKCGLAAFTNWVKAILVKTSGGGDGGIVVHPLATVHGPVVVAKVVHSAIASVINEAVFACFITPSSIDTLHFNFCCLKKDFDFDFFYPRAKL
jgi:hypothetical protein